MIRYNGVSMDGAIFAAIVFVFIITMVYLELRAWQHERLNGFRETMLRKAEEEMEE